MKVPISSPKHSTITSLQNNTTPCYEPTSVLDLRRSPSPVCGKPAAAAAAASVVVVPDTNNSNSLEWEEHVLQNFDWDSIMKELDFDNSSKGESVLHHIQSLPDLSSSNHHHHHPLQLINHQIPDFNDVCSFNSNISAVPSHQDLISLDSHNYNWNSNFTGFDLIQELIRAADCVDSNEIQLADGILEKLNHRLHSPVGKPLQRAAFFFKEALQLLLINSVSANSRPPPANRIASCSDVIQTIKAYKVFSAISPIPMFNHFTVNQALFETIDDSPPFVHVIDFDIGLGCHYASFMRELVEKSDYSKLTSPVLRITAIVSEDYAIQTHLIKQCLSQYAIELQIRFQIEFVLAGTFEMVSFKSIKFIDGEKTAILLSPAFFRRLGSNSSINNFVIDLRRVSPSVVVVVDYEGWAEASGASFRRNFVNGLEFFAIIFESIDAAAAAARGEWARKIEMLLIKPMIIAAVEGCGRRVSRPWREVLGGAGMRQLQFSQFADFQAECLLGKVQVRGFYVAKRQAELVLCWHERPLIATSSWKSQK